MDAPRDTLRQRALEEALRDPRKHLAHVRELDGALGQARARAAARAKVSGPLGVLGLVGGGVLAALAAAAVVATPVGWIAAGGAAALGLSGLGVASAARRRERTAAERRKSLRLGHDGRALEIDALLARIDQLREAVAGDYARYERRVLAEVGPERHRDNAALLQGLRARQLAHIKRLDDARAAAVALRERCVTLAITAEVDDKLERLEHARERWDDTRARNAFARDDVAEAIARLGAETDALEQLERELG